MKKGVFIIFIMLLLLLSLVNAAKVDKVIEEKLENQDEISVIVKLKDEPVEKFSVLNKDFDRKLSKRKEMVERQQEKVLANLNKFSVSGKGGKNTDFKLKNKYSVVNGFSGKVTKEGLEKLRNDPNVEKIYFDEPMSISLDVSVPKINATKVWGLVYNNTNITGKYETVCVIDTGIDYTHPNLGNCGSTDNINDGSCSKVIGGYNYCANEECTAENSNPIDNNGHGTHVAGIIASNHTTYRGVAPDAKLVALKACNSTGSCAESSIVSSIDWCINNALIFNISVITMSLGGGSYDSICDGADAVVDEANLAANLGLFVSAAAGNYNGGENVIASPACGSNVTAVGAVDDNDAITFNRAPFMSILAPGVSITSTVLRSGGVISDPSGFKAVDGTSMSTPHVAGAAALLFQYGKLKAGIVLTPKQIQNALNSTGISITDGSNTYRRIDVFAALNSLNMRVSEITINSTDSLNRTNGTLIGSWSFSGIGRVNQTLNETKWFNNSIEVSELANLTIVSHTNTTKNQNWTFSARVYDGANWSEWATATIQIKNAAPELQTIATITVNETGLVNITANATDIDNDVINYTINDSRFTKLVNQFTWLTNTSHSGVYYANITANDSTDIDSQIVVVNVLNAPDFDNDGNPDFNDTDDDNDGMADDSDYLTGNVSDITTTTPLKLRINGSENTTRIFKDTLKINITDENNNSLIEFDWNFTNSILVINWTIDYVAGNGTIIIRNLDVAKTVYLNKSTTSHNYVCITDKDITSISLMTSGCSGVNETKVSCTGSSGQYGCTNLGNNFKVSGLSHSAVKGLYVAPSSDNSGGSSGSGGGGGGGGGGTVSRDPNEASRFFAVLTETFHPLIGINSPNIPIDRLSFNVNKKLYSVRVNIKALNKTSTPVKISGEVYQYLNLSTENLNDSDLAEPVEIKFKVSKLWLEQKDVDKDDISLYRYKEKWNKLDTEIEIEDNSTVFYVSKTPGFSIFAIAAEKAEEIKPKEEKKIDIKVEETKEAPAITEIEGGKVKEEEDSFFVITGKFLGKTYREKPWVVVLLSVLTILVLFYARKRKK